VDVFEKYDKQGIVEVVELLKVSSEVQVQLVTYRQTFEVVLIVSSSYLLYFKRYQEQ
jgi:hypothetical protein